MGNWLPGERAAIPSVGSFSEKLHIFLLLTKGPGPGLTWPTVFCVLGADSGVVQMIDSYFTDVSVADVRL